NGYKTVFEVAEATAQEIIGIPGFDNEEQAQTLINSAKEMVDSGKVIIKTSDEKFTVSGKRTADEILREEMQQLTAREKDLDAEESELLKVRGVGPSLVKELNNAGVTNIQELAEADIEAVKGKIDWENKDELDPIYVYAKLLNNENLIEQGKLKGFVEAEKLSSIIEATKSVILRMGAAGYDTVSSVSSSTLEEFKSKMMIDDKKAEVVYNALKSL
ncbi:MAG TPA: helix-hairpin-helix domain-containing protein, partial [bacterium]|nr:helix-hairpin-helix domain-containing protein [bacterium]